MIKKIMMGVLGTVTTAIVVAAVFYPEDFAMVLVGLLVGLFFGILLATVLMESYFHKGATMAHDLQKKQVLNPAMIMREARLSEKEDNKQPQPNSLQQPTIPQFDMTGLIDSN